MSEKGFTLKWNGKEVMNLCEDQLKEILSEAALVAEGYAKKELRKTGGKFRRRHVRNPKHKTVTLMTSSHGVITGTLRRSIHVAKPDYDFASDDVVPSNNTPERGNQKVVPDFDGKGRSVLALGSGLKYALKIHQGWGTFEGYHYITIGADKTKAHIGTIVKRHQV